MNKLTYIKNKLLNLIDNYKIDYILITTIGNKIKCIELIELENDEEKIIIAKVRNGLFKTKIITVYDKNIEYIIESFDNDTWEMLCGLKPNEIIVEENSLYG